MAFVVPFWIMFFWCVYTVQDIGAGLERQEGRGEGVW